MERNIVQERRQSKRVPVGDGFFVCLTAPTRRPWHKGRTSAPAAWIRMKAAAVLVAAMLGTASVPLPAFPGVSPCEPCKEPDRSDWCYYAYEYYGSGAIGYFGDDCFVD